MMQESTDTEMSTRLGSPTSCSQDRFLSVRLHERFGEDVPEDFHEPSAKAVQLPPIVGERAKSISEILEDETLTDCFVVQDTQAFLQSRGQRVPPMPTQPHDKGKVAFRRRISGDASRSADVRPIPRVANSMPDLAGMVNASRESDAGIAESIPGAMITPPFDYKPPLRRQILSELPTSDRHHDDAADSKFVVRSSCRRALRPLSRAGGSVPDLCSMDEQDDNLSTTCTNSSLPEIDAESDDVDTMYRPCFKDARREFTRKVGSMPDLQSMAFDGDDCAGEDDEVILQVRQGIGEDVNQKGKEMFDNDLLEEIDPSDAELARSLNSSMFAPLPKGPKPIRCVAAGRRWFRGQVTGAAQTMPDLPPMDREPSS